MGATSNASRVDVPIPALVWNVDLEPHHSPQTFGRGGEALCHQEEYEALRGTVDGQ